VQYFSGLTGAVFSDKIYIMEEISERIEVCIAVENAVADIYNSFSNMFPEARIFFKELSKEEEDHATILMVAKAYHRVGKLPEHIVPGPLPDIYGTLDHVRNVKERVKSDDISLKEALDIAAEIEDAVAESLLQETLRKETDERVILNLKKLMLESKTHSQRIREFRNRRGI
jgi:DNA-binding ferritin-like protein